MSAPVTNLKGVDLLDEIARLKKERNAIILAHYYQRPEIQDLADYVGDSLELSRKAQVTDAAVIAFCGVRFMAETAKILSPEKRVILPDMDAGCSLEDSCPPDQFKAFREKHPDHIALTYINCSTEVKALSDIIVTSSSAEKILSQIPDSQPIIFGPDKHLGGYLARKTGRDMLLWPGVCIVHEAFSTRAHRSPPTLNARRILSSMPIMSVQPAASSISPKHSLATP
jgi:quinolinate synthase